MEEERTEVDRMARLMELYVAVSLVKFWQMVRDEPDEKAMRSLAVDLIRSTAESAGMAAVVAGVEDMERASGLPVSDLRWLYDSTLYGVNVVQ